MKRRKFVQSSVIGASALSTGFLGKKQNTKAKAFFELRVYELPKRGRKKLLDNYLKEALFPTFNKTGINPIGAFTELGMSEPIKLYLLIPYPSISVYQDKWNRVKNDPGYQMASKEYHALPPDKPIYTRYSSSLMLAFDRLPDLVVPGQKNSLFELRTYEGYNEDAVRRKIKMFNKEEIDLFLQTGLNPVFFGEMISGNTLPCLTYMLGFKDMEERMKNWKTFVDHPEWKRMSKDPQYASSVSKIHKIFLEPLPYSQV